MRYLPSCGAILIVSDNYGGEYNSGAGEINGMSSGYGSYDPNDQSGSVSGSSLPPGGDHLDTDDVFGGDGAQDQKGRQTVKRVPVLPSGIGPTLPDGSSVADVESIYGPNGGENSSTVSVFDMNVKASLKMYDFLEAITSLVPFYKTCGVKRAETEYALRAAFRGVLGGNYQAEALLGHMLNKVYAMPKKTPEGLTTIAAAIRRDVNRIFISGSTVQANLSELYTEYDAWLNHEPATMDILRGMATRARVAYDGVVRTGSIIRIASDPDAQAYVRGMEETPAAVRVHVAWLTAPDKAKVDVPALEAVTCFAVSEADARLGKAASINGEITLYRHPEFFYRNAFVRQCEYLPADYAYFVKWAGANYLHGQVFVDTRKMLVQEGYVSFERTANDAVLLKKTDGSKEIAALPQGAPKPDSGTVVKTNEGDKTVE